MLEKLDLTKEMSKEDYRDRMEVLEAELGRLQRQCRNLGIPVMIAFEVLAALSGVRILRNWNRRTI